MATNSKTEMEVPYFRPSIGDAEIAEVVECLRSGWLTTGPRVNRFEIDFAEAVGAEHAVAVNSCTAALHLAVEALGLQAGQAVLVPTLTFAATAEVVRYQGAVPVLVDCDPQTLNIDLADAEEKLAQAQSGRLLDGTATEVVGVIPVHVGGLMVDMNQMAAFAERHGLWVVEDAAHALPAAYRVAGSVDWRKCGENTAPVTCFSFYANKTITTAEGGMAVTKDARLGERIRQMSLHGLSRDGWKRHQQNEKWDYQIEAPGFKYNLTDVAAAVGIHQLARAEQLRKEREQIAALYRESFGDMEELELPHDSEDRVHAWHLYQIRLRLDKLAIDRNQFVAGLCEAGVGFSVHWRPLHLHPYYADRFGWTADQLPVAGREWERLVSLPIFPGMREEELRHVTDTVRSLCVKHSNAGTNVPQSLKPR